MTHFHKNLCGLVVVTMAISLTACGKSETDKVDPNMVTAQELPVSTQIGGAETNPLAAVVGASEIPYPMYPNGTKYRVGGENGLKIVVFQTEDAFDKVDSYYSDLSNNAGMARITAMNDYVRYSNGTEDLDPWATHLPGIVIHEFTGEEERQAVGASAVAQTNIIMSF